MNFEILMRMMAHQTEKTKIDDDAQPVEKRIRIESIDN